MPWTKTSDDYPDDCYRDGLSDSAYRTHHEGLSWSNRHLLDGRLAKRDLRRALLGENADAAVAELVALDYWRDVGTHYEIVAHLGDQQTRDQVLRRRKVDTERQSRKRDADLARAEARLTESTSPRASRRDTDRESRRDTERTTRVTLDGTGQARTGQDQEQDHTSRVTSPKTEPATGWPPVRAIPTPPETRPCSRCDQPTTRPPDDTGYVRCDRHARQAGLLDDDASAAL